MCGYYIFMTLKNWLTFPYLALISLSFIWSNITFSLFNPCDYLRCSTVHFCMWTIHECGYTHFLDILHWILLDILACTTLDFSAKMKTSLDYLLFVHTYRWQVKSVIICWEHLGNFRVLHRIEVRWVLVLFHKQPICLLYGPNLFIWLNVPNSSLVNF